MAPLVNLCDMAFGTGLSVEDAIGSPVVMNLPGVSTLRLKYRRAHRGLRSQLEG